MALRMTWTDAETQIRELIEDWANAARAKNVDAIFAHYAPDILAFDAIGQLQFKGADACRKHWDACMSMCPGQMVFEVHDLEIEAQGDLAFGHYLSRCGGTGPDGKERSGWLRATICCRKTNGSWRIVHEHFSAPFDLESGKVLDLRP
jgi:uncharacterized protein (TIGR02246 family)